MRDFRASEPTRNGQRTSEPGLAIRRKNTRLGVLCVAMSLRAVWHLGLLGSLVGAVLAATHLGPAANTTDPLTHAPVSPHPSPLGGFAVPLVVGGLCAVVLGAACLLELLRRTCRGWGRYHPYMDPVVV